MTTNNYFDHQGGIYPFGENSVLFRAHYEYLLARFHRPSSIDDVKKLIETYKIGDNHFQFSKEEGYSHDNELGIRGLSALYSLEHHRRRASVGWFPQRAQPWNVIFNMQLYGGVYKALSMPFLWILSLHMIISCFRGDNSPNGIFRTSGKLLAWLRMECINMPITKKICTLLVKRHGGWYNMFNIYFNKDENHPIIKLAKSLGPLL